MKKFYISFFLLGILFFQCRTALVKTSNPEFQNYSISNSNGNSNQISEIIEPYKVLLDKNMDKELAISPMQLDKSQLNSNVGNWMANLVLEESEFISNEQIDFCLLNRGGIRSIIDKGPVTVREIFEIMPFNNEVVIVDLDKKGINAMLDYLANNWVGHPLIGIELKKINNKVQIVSEQKKIYKVVTSDYLLNGGDNMTFFQLAKSVKPLNIKLRDLIIQHTEKQDTLIVPTIKSYKN